MNVSRLPRGCVPWVSQSSGHPISHAADVFLFGKELLARSSLWTCNSSSAFSADTRWRRRSLWTWATAQKRDTDSHTGAKAIATGMRCAEDEAGTCRERHRPLVQEHTLLFCPEKVRNSPPPGRYVLWWSGDSQYRGAPGNSAGEATEKHLLGTTGLHPQRKRRDEASYPQQHSTHIGPVNLSHLCLDGN